MTPFVACLKIERATGKEEERFCSNSTSDFKRFNSDLGKPKFKAHYKVLTAS